MFDLPVMTDEERRTASRFRKDLLDHGYLMIQFSVYARPCVSFDQVQKHISSVQKLTPAAGNVRIIYMTDQQWKSSVNVIGKNYDQGKRALDPSVPKQVEFWE